MSIGTHFIIQLSEECNYKLHIFKDFSSNDKALDSAVDHMMTYYYTQMSFLIKKFIFVYNDEPISVSQFKKPSLDYNKWIMLRIKRNNKTWEDGGCVLILQYDTKRKRLTAIPICDIHKLPYVLITWEFLDDNDDMCIDMDRFLYNQSGNENALHNNYNKNVNLFTLMLESVDLNNSNKKRRFY